MNEWTRNDLRQFPVGPTVGPIHCMGPEEGAGLQELPYFLSPLLLKCKIKMHLSTKELTCTMACVYLTPCTTFFG